MSYFRLALAQINCTMGDIAGNCEKIREYLAEAKKQQVSLIAFPELAVTGYPPEDLLFKQSFVHSNLQALEKIRPFTTGITAVVGFVNADKQGIYNAAAVLSNGELLGVYNKICLANYGVFDEKRYFKEGMRSLVLTASGTRVGLCICEDLWHPDGPIASLVEQGGAQLILAINASPYHAGKWKQRQKVIHQQARRNRVTIAYSNLVGGQDELLFDGHSLVYDPQGVLLAQGHQFKEDLVVLDIQKSKLADHAPEHSRQGIVSIDIPSYPVANPIAPTLRPLLPYLREIYEALLLGVRDYTVKNGFSKVLIGLSGGIDSALTLTLAVDALGKDNVTAVFMPSRYTSRESVEDSRELARNLGVSLEEISIENVFNTYLEQLAPHFAGCSPNIAEENIQARIRGNFLMALSNKFNWLVLTTGNKSEMSVGYATLYGDMAGGFAVIKDVVKTLVYQLSEYRNSRSSVRVIPQRILEKEPSAELAAGQKDSDSLPPYSALDPILTAYVEEEKGVSEIIGMGFSAQMVKRVIELVDRSEYKRRQSPIGIKITPKAFGRDRRLPVTNRFKP